MNINELFFFKVFECIKESNKKLNKSSHNEKNCYFYHKSVDFNNNQNNNSEKDRRREQISFSLFFKNLKMNLEEGNKIISLDSIFEFKNKENLDYYTNKTSFLNYNEYIYNQFDCCKNEIEYLYHIKNYKKNKCLHYSCKKKFCDKYHHIDKNNENENNGINLFKNTLDLWIEKKEIKLIEIIELFNKILSFKNKYLSKMQLNEIKQEFEPFLKFYEENKNRENNNLMNINEYQNMNNKKAQRILQEIHRNLSQNNEKFKIYKNNNIFDVLSISTNICYFPSSEFLKSGDIIKYIYSLLNSSNGIIIYGVLLLESNNYIVKGISIKQKEREKFIKWFNHEFLKILMEYEGYIKYKFYDLANNNNEECILVINVKQIKFNQFLMTSSKKYYVIKENFLMNKRNEKNKILKDEDVIELNTKQYINLLRKRFLLYYSKKYGIHLKTNSAYL